MPHRKPRQVLRATEHPAVRYDFLRQQPTLPPGASSTYRTDGSAHSARRLEARCAAHVSRGIAQTLGLLSRAFAPERARPESRAWGSSLDRGQWRPPAARLWRSNWLMGLPYQRARMLVTLCSRLRHLMTPIIASGRRLRRPDKLSPSARRAAQAVFEGSALSWRETEGRESRPII